ncbi:MAG TPA: FG-GAP-like repeat-containing protein [Polyangia bacterium]|nr:FG-GAP-like repeat-containing protein [Polyangia bacterium]
MRAGIRATTRAIALASVVLAGCQGPGTEGETQGVEEVSQALTGVPNVIGGARVACGSPYGIGNFLPDTNSDGQGATKERDATVDVSAPGAAPAAVYEFQRYQNATNGTMTYTFTGLPPSMPINVRLHFAETNPANNAVGKRLFNVAINGTTVLSSFDIFATAGKVLNKAVVENFKPNADANGQIAVKFTQIPNKDAATINGIEVFPDPTTIGTWTTKAMPLNYDGNTVTFGGWAVQPELLTDGSILLGDMSGADGSGWYKLTPDINGKYESGTWTHVASNNIPRDLAPSSMTASGKYLIAGGEDTVGDFNHSSLEIYDPVADSWNLQQSHPDPLGIGDTASSILPDGRWYVSSFRDSNTFIFNPQTLLWQQGPAIDSSSATTGAITPGCGSFQNGDERGWTLLQNGKLLDIFDSWSLFDPSTLKWSTPTSSGVTVVSQCSWEIGPASLLYDGRLLQFGATNGGKGSVAIFDPKGMNVVAGASAPDSNQWGDTSASVMINGHVLSAPATGNTGVGATPAIWDYDPTQPLDSAYTKIAARSASDGLPAAATFPGMAAPIFLQLPTGQTLYIEGGGDTNLHFYMPNNLTAYQPQTNVSPQYRPAITSISAPSSGVFTLTGTQINGLTNGASFGDDRNMASNYPLVYLQDASNRIFYARTFNFSSMTPAPAPTTHTCNFTLPPSIPNGTYTVHVSASGVASTTATSLTVSGVHLASVSGPTVGPGATATWTVALQAASASSQTVSITSDNANVVTSNQSTVTIPAGQTSATFTVTGRGAGLGHVTAALSTPNAQFQPVTGVFGALVQSVRRRPGGDLNIETLGASPIPSAQTWTVTISNPAPTGGMAVRLTTNMGSVSVPSTVTVPAGQRKATFRVSRFHPGPSAMRPILPATSGSITASMSGSSKSYPLRVHARNDINGDAISDIPLTGGNNFSGIPVVLSVGDGSFTFLTQLGETTGDSTFPASSELKGAKAIDGDFDNDGFADTALLGVSATTIPVAFAQTGQLDSSGNFLPLGSFHGTNTAVSGDTTFPAKAMLPGVQVLAGDFDGNGSVDLALTGGSSFTGIPVAFSQMSDNDRLSRTTEGSPFDGLFSGANGTATLQAGAAALPGGVSFATLAAGNVQAVAGDFDGDGLTDVALVGLGLNNIPIAHSQGNGNFTVSNGSTLSQGESGFSDLCNIEGAKAVAGDFNGDGRADIALAIGLSTPQELGLCTANADGKSFFCTLAPFSASSTDPNFPFYATLEGARLAAGDFDGDGYDDIAVTGGIGWGSIPVAFSNGDGTFKGVNIGGTQAAPFYALASSPGAAPTTTPPLDRIVDVGLEKNDAIPTACTVGGTTMHCCPTGTAMTGIRADQNIFKCAPIVPAITWAPTLDTGTQRNGMHACPLGSVMVGFHADLNRYACQALPANAITREDTDTNSNDGFMHVCNDTRFGFMTGVNVASNLLTCSVGLN